MVEVGKTNLDAVGYLTISCIVTIRQECKAIQEELEGKDSVGAITAQTEVLGYVKSSQRELFDHG